MSWKMFLRTEESIKSAFGRVEAADKAGHGVSLPVGIFNRNVAAVISLPSCCG